MKDQVTAPQTETQTEPSTEPSRSSRPSVESESAPSASSAVDGRASVPASAENEKAHARHAALTEAAKLLAVDVRNSAEYASHYLQAHNHEAAAEAYKRLLDRLNAAHQILSQQIENWPTI